MGRHAYLILAHKNPGQIRKLLGLLDDRRNDIYVHIDRKASFKPADLEGSCTRSGLHFIQHPISVHWGGVSIMKAELILLKAAVRGHYDYYHLLSGMDLPLKSQNTIHDFFDAHPGKEFLMLWKASGSAMDRVDYYRLLPDGNRFFIPRWINDTFTSLSKLLNLRRKEVTGIYFASQWFSIEDDFANFLLQNEKHLLRDFGHVNICDEIFIATTLLASEYAPRLYDSKLYDEHTDINNMANLRYVDWGRSGNGRHPWTFTLDDLQTLKDTPHFWARKFDENTDSEIIDRICRLQQEK